MFHKIQKIEIFDWNLLSLLNCAFSALSYSSNFTTSFINIFLRFSFVLLATNPFSCLKPFCGFFCFTALASALPYAVVVVVLFSFCHTQIISDWMFHSLTKHYYAWVQMLICIFFNFPGFSYSVIDPGQKLPLFTCGGGGGGTAIRTEANKSRTEETFWPLN